MDRHNLWVSVDNYKRKAYLKYEIKKILLVSYKKSKKINYMTRYRAAFHLSMIPRSLSKTRLSNRCVFSGRVWSVNRKTNYSRFVFRDEAYKSNIPGFRRASW